MSSSQSRIKPSVDGTSEAPSQQYGGGHTGGWVDLLPASWIPYVQLARLSPPAGLFLIYFPHFFGCIHIAVLRHSDIPHLGRVAVLLLGGSLFFSNAAHAWNDLIDAPIDKQVARTRKRPIVRGAISPRAAFVFTATQVLGAGAFLLLLSPNTALCTIPNIIGTTYYPWAKRHTSFAQLVLGFCLAWGVIIGAAAMGDEPWNNTGTQCLFAACVLWTAIYDTVYAHQDVKDDIKLGLKSTATLFRERTKPFLWFLLVSMISLIVACGRLGDMGYPYYVIAAGGCAASLGAMIANVELRSSSSCWWWFRYGFWLAGGSMTGGLISEYMSRHVLQT